LKAFKVVGIILVLLCLLLGVGAYLAYSNMGALIKYAVETEGPGITKTSVTLDNAELDLVEGRAELQGFTVGNPEGFSSDYLFTLGGMTLEIDTQSLNSDVVVIKNFTVDGVNFLVEQKGTRTNLQSLMDNLPASDSAESSTEDTGGGSTNKRFMIENLVFSAGSMKLVTEKYGEKELSIPTLKVTDVGNKTQGLTTGELGVEIFSQLLGQAKRTVKNAASDEIEAKLKEKLLDKYESEVKDSDKLNEAKEKLKKLF